MPVPASELAPHGGGFALDVNRRVAPPFSPSEELILPKMYAFISAVGLRLPNVHAFISAVGLRLSNIHAFFPAAGLRLPNIHAYLSAVELILVNARAGFLFADA